MAYTPSCLRGLLSILILASILVAGWAVEPPSHYRVELTHVDANGGFSRGELIRRAEHRTHLRAATLSAAAASPNTYMAHYSEHEYLVDLEIGTPPQRFQAVLDTGSSIVLLTNLSLCNTTSPSFTHAKCSQSQSQSQSQSAGPTPTEGTCCGGLRMFERTYGEEQTMRGFMGTETMSFISATTGDAVPIPGVLVSCTIYTDCHTQRNGHSVACRKLPKHAAGIVGLGLGPGSLVKQRSFRKFSYCLNDQLKPHLNSLLVLGDGPPPVTIAGSKAESSTTTLTTGTGVDRSKYYVKLCDISIGGGFEPDEHKKCEVDMLVDSGTSYTYLEPAAFDKVQTKVADLFNNNLAPKSKITNCYPAAGLVKGSKQPEMILQFGDKAVMHVPWNSYMISHESDWCLAVKKSTNGMVILGNFQQQNMKMFFDLDEWKLSFVPTDCTRP